MSNMKAGVVAMEDYPNSSNVEFQTQRHKPLAFRILLIVAFILAIVALIFIILYAVEKSSQAKPKINEAGTPCTTRECVRTAFEILNQLNQSADPCDDFFTYACGGYIAQNPLKDGETSRSGFSDAGYKNLQVLKKSLESASIKYAKNEAVMKAVRFYNSCLDDLEVNNQGDSPLKELINKYGGWDVLGHAINSSRNTMDLLADVERDIGVKPLLNVMVAVDIHNSSAHIVQLKTATLGMSKTLYFNNSAENIKVQNAYKKYMKTIAKLLGGSAESDKKMMEVYEFEAKLAKLEMKAYGSSITETLRQSISVAAASGAAFDIRTSIKTFGLQTSISSDFVIKFLERVFKDQKKTFTPEDRMIAYPISYFQQVVALFNQQLMSDVKVIDNYIMWTMVNNFVPSMSSNFTNARSLYQDALTGQQTRYRWKSCIRGMQSFFGMTMGFLFVESAFDEKSKKTIEEMSGYLRSAFLEELESNNWMSAWTRLRAREKALAIKEDIGYPPYIKDPELLAADYSGLQIAGDFFKNTLSLSKYYSKKNLDLLGKAVDKDKWHLSPSQVNGYYSPKQNRIVFLAGILQPPFYNPTFPKYLNFGGIGMVIGHEITHGFDTSGALYDKDGNINSWWSAVSHKNFKQKTQCLRSQYSKYKVFGQNVNGNQTVNENIADNGGIKLAYKAYLDWTRKNGAEKPLPGVGLSVDQLFFVGFAKAWCSIYTKEPALVQLRTDSHTFEKYRIIGSVSNFPKFSEAFKCKPASPMNPASKCSVW